MSASFEHLEKRIAFLEREQRRTNAIIDGLEERSDKNLADINQHLNAQDSKHEEFAQETNAHFEQQDAKLEKFAQETKENFARTDARMDGLDQSVGELKQDVGELKQNVGELKQSINERFDHVYGAIADVSANVMELRNIIASLVEKQK